MKNKIMAVLAIILVAMLAITGCGGTPEGEVEEQVGIESEVETENQVEVESEIGAEVEEEVSE